VAVHVLGTGVVIRLADEDEARAVEQTRRGREFRLEPERSYRLAVPERPLSEGEVYVVGQTFVDFVDDEGGHHWTAAEQHGWRISEAEDATVDLLRLAEEAAADWLIDLLGDMGIAGVGVSRWSLMSAPGRIVLTPELEGRQSPLRRR
jgi:hypothetical protein